MNDAEKALLDRLRQLVVETPTSGALNAAKQPLYVTRFSQAVERRAADGQRLVAYVREKVYEKETSSYSALIEAGRPDLTVEALVADAGAPWASLFTDADREVAGARLGALKEAHRQKLHEIEAAAAAEDRRVVANMNARRAESGKPPLTSAQEAAVLDRRRAARAASD
jgi:hypothetical protein